MSLPTLLKRLPRELLHLAAVYDIVSREHPLLAPYPTLSTLLAKLKPNGRWPAPERKGLVSALICIHRASPHKLWSTVLLHVFDHMLKKVRKKLRGGDAPTRDALLVEVFLEGLTRVRTDDPDRIFMYVRQETRRGAFHVLREGATWETIGFGIEADLEPDPNTLDEPALVGVWMRDLPSSEEKLELLATLVDRGGLQSLVRKRHPDLDPTEQARAFRCLQKRRTRLVARLRDQLRAEAAA
jgi:hypothetical protein